MDDMAGAKRELANKEGPAMRAPVPEEMPSAVALILDLKRHIQPTPEQPFLGIRSGHPHGAPDDPVERVEIENEQEPLLAIGNDLFDDSARSLICFRPGRGSDRLRI